jgi:hypothetical protein
MKQLFRCEYCSETGTADEIAKHEAECIFNYDKRSCLTCKHAENKFTKYICNAGKDIPEGKYLEQCSNYEWDEKDHTGKSIFGGNLFGGLF